jgi:hypothetical protein
VKVCRVALVVTGLIALTGGCQSAGDSAQGVAERFVDEHYVRMNLPAAREYCVGVARHKVDEEARLVGDQVIDASTRKPRVSYELKETARADEVSASFVFEAVIHVDGADSFNKRWLVNTRRETDGWKVSNFSEYE